MKYYIYILRCRDGKLYTGITTDMERRFSEHLSGDKGAKFTRSDPPEEIAALWSCDGRSSASKLEYALKKLRRDRKLQLIADDSLLPELIKNLDCSVYKRER